MKEKPLDDQWEIIYRALMQNASSLQSFKALGTEKIS